MPTALSLVQPLSPNRLSSAAQALAASASHAENLSLRADIAALVEAGAVLTGVLAASGDCIKVLDLDGRILFLNDAGHKALEVTDKPSLHGRSWTDFWPDEPAAQAALVQSRRGLDSSFTGTAPTLLGNDRRWDVRVTPIRSAAAEVTQILVISRDITEQHRLETQKALLAGELEHRIKNILTMVVAIAQQTLRPPATLAEAADGFAARIEALARAQAILTRTSWHSADIHLVAEGALEPHRIRDNTAQFVLSGPHVQLSASRALALVLSLHELATNAAKYGALSVPEGSVHLNWQSNPGDAAEGFVLEWREQDGPPVVKPTRTGFGSKLLQRVLAVEFRGSVQIEYATTGVTLLLTAPLE